MRCICRVQANHGSLSIQRWQTADRLVAGQCRQARANQAGRATRSLPALRAVPAPLRERAGMAKATALSLALLGQRRSTSRACPSGSCSITQTRPAALARITITSRLGITHGDGAVIDPKEQPVSHPLAGSSAVLRISPCRHGAAARGGAPDRLDRASREPRHAPPPQGHSGIRSRQSVAAHEATPERPVA